MSNKSGQLPIGWIKILDKPSGKYFYVNLKTKRRQWNDPRDSYARSVRYSGELRALPTGWYIAFDPETKRDYYFNTYTNVSQWHFPSESQSGSQKQAETNQLEAALKNVRVTLSSESLHKSTVTSPTSTESDQIKKEINRRKAKNEFK